MKSLFDPRDSWTLHVLGLVSPRLGVKCDTPHRGFGRLDLANVSASLEASLELFQEHAKALEKSKNVAVFWRRWYTHIDSDWLTKTGDGGDSPRWRYHAPPWFFMRGRHQLGVPLLVVSRCLSNCVDSA